MNNSVVEHLTVEDAEFLDSLTSKKRTEYLESGFFRAPYQRIKEDDKKKCKEIKKELEEWRKEQKKILRELKKMGKSEPIKPPPKWYMKMRKDLKSKQK